MKYKIGDKVISNEINGIYEIIGDKNTPFKYLNWIEKIAEIPSGCDYVLKRIDVGIHALYFAPKKALTKYKI